ncbi:hypothetical protein LPC08_11485 [Roseomonas sp. OT10]|uniref:TSCPD domain-containing protein n=1 Tax=Roseomonas cutis TaxID=2897332 RepID=UPI001E39B20B|nr:hypothetical protein [Roseomonas sp. OT10]UFN51175.1 hypothetical protein LPC08_11485 [Roseomonas sp. OT10]
MPQTDGTPWSDVTLRRLPGRADPDSASRPVAIPAAWDAAEAAADALAALAPAGRPASLPKLAEAWLKRVAEGAARTGLLPPEAAAALVADLRALLLLRRGAPGESVWTGEAEDAPRFVLNLPAFLDEEGGFDAAAYAAAARLAVLGLEALSAGKARRLRVGFADLAGLLAGLGLDYEGAEARNVAAAVAALTRGAAEAASGECAEALGERVPLALDWPAPPEATAVPGLAAAARAALDAAAGAPGLRHESVFALSPADAVEALLGAESAGFAPAAGPGRRDPVLGEVPTAAARRAGARAASLLAPRRPAARAAMAAVLAPWLREIPAPPVPAAAPRPAPSPVDAHRALRGRAWKVAVGGHRVTLHATDHPDGTLAEISLNLAKDGAAFRGLLDALCQTVSLALARGVPLAELVQAHAYTRFGPAGAVEGDPSILRASSILDWAFRRLALEYLDLPPLADPAEEECAAESAGSPGQQQPLLPLGGPGAAGPGPRPRRRALRLVG